MGQRVELLLFLSLLHCPTHSFLILWFKIMNNDVPRTLTKEETQVQADFVSEENLYPSKTHVEWPAEPQPLVPSQSSYIFDLLHDIALCVAPIALLVKCALVVLGSKWDAQNTGQVGSQPTKLTRNLIHFNDQLVTLFTILFVTTIACFVKRLALWRAQRGASVSTLEQFQASVSMTSTLNVIYQLRAWKWISVGLVVLWSVRFFVR
jgi:hypothetical protein